MRDDIIVRDEDGNVVYDADGSMLVDYYKAIGTGYARGFFTNCHCRYRVYEGGRSTKKSYDMIGYESVLKIVNCPLRNVVVLRQNDVDHRQTTFEQIRSAIDDLGFSGSFSTRMSPLEIEYRPTGQKIIFRGLNNPTSLNGIKFKVGYWTDAYLEEAYEVKSYDDFRKVDGSMRGRLPEGYFFQLTLCMNAWGQDTWIYDRFFKGRLEDDYVKLDDPGVRYMDWLDEGYVGDYGRGLYLHKSTYKINEFRAPDYDVAAAETKRVAPEIYKVEFLGMWGNATEAVYPEFSDALVHPSSFFLGRDQQGRRNMEFSEVSVGVDTGYSDGAGKRLTVKKGEKPSEKVKAATTMQLCALSSDLGTMCVLDEWFHSNNRSDNASNTDGREALTVPEIASRCVATLRSWIDRYGEAIPAMRGSLDVYVDSADIGFRDALDMEARKQGLLGVRFFGATKLPIQSRVDFLRLMMAYGDFAVSELCPNLIRELKNARRGEKGEARTPGNDHANDAMDYGFGPLLGSLKRWKTFKIR